MNDTENVVDSQKNNKYSICTVANDLYLEFLYYFVESALNSCKSLHKIHILFTGDVIPDIDIYKNPIVNIVKHSTEIKTVDIWDNGWKTNVDLKTQFLKKIAHESDHPIFLIDVDSLFLEEFVDEIDLTKDLVVCKRIIPYANRKYIASFIGLINPKKCITFLESWINQINNINQTPRETLALCLVMESIGQNLSVQEIEDDVVSCVHVNSPPKCAKILHFKSRSIGNAKHNVDERFKTLRKII